MKNVLILFLLILSFGYLQVVKASPRSSLQPSQSLVELQGLFKKSVVECGQKIWPSFDPLKSRYLIVDESGESLWELKSSGLLRIDDPEKLAMLKGTAFNFSEFQGVPATSVSLFVMKMRFDPSLARSFGSRSTTEKPPLNFSEEALTLLMHEAFHFQGQKEWGMSTSGARGTYFPYDHRPRYFRRMVFEKLAAYLKDMDPQMLEEASYWYHQWKEKFSEEVASTTDGYEGTAKYIDQLVLYFSREGCSSDSENFRKFILRESISESKKMMTSDSATLDREGYHLGSLASFILRLQHGNQAGTWEERVAQGATPLEILLERFPPKESSGAPEIETSYERAAQEKQNYIAPLINETYANLLSRDYIRLSIPTDWLGTTYSPIAFLLLREPKDYSLTPMRSPLLFSSKTGKSVVRSSPNAVFFSKGRFGNFCGDSWTLLVPRSGVTNTGSTWAVDHPLFIKGQIEGSLQTDSEGLNWICASPEEK